MTAPNDDDVLMATWLCTSTGCAHLPQTLPQTLHPFVDPIGPTPCALLPVEVNMESVGEEVSGERAGATVLPSSKCKCRGGASFCQDDASCKVVSMCHHV